MINNLRPGNRVIYILPYGDLYRQHGQVENIINDGPTRSRYGDFVLIKFDDTRRASYSVDLAPYNKFFKRLYGIEE